MPPKNKNLVYSSAGRSSKHGKFWLDDAAARTFDLALTNFTDARDLHAGDADYDHQRRGAKWSNFHHFLEKFPVVDDYDYFFALDDDIELTTRQINDCFALMERHGLALAQPTFLPWDTVSYDITLCDPGNVLRFTSFVECNATLFSRAALKTCRSTFVESETGAGIDGVWPKLLGYPEDKIAQLDCVPCRHRRRKSELDDYLPRAVQHAQGRSARGRYGAVAKMLVYKAVPRPFGVGRALTAGFYKAAWTARELAHRIKTAVSALRPGPAG